MKKLLLIRRVVGDSMLPNLRSGQIVLGAGFGYPKIGDLVIFSHKGIEKIKRVSDIEGEKLYALGDNAVQSTDSRQFGWVHRTQVVGRVIWPRL